MEIRSVLWAVVIVTAVVVVQVVASTTTPPPPTGQCKSSCPSPGVSLLSGLLNLSGFSDTCVAAALDACAPASPEGHFETVMQGLRDAVQELSHTIKQSHTLPRDCRDILRAGITGSGVRTIYPFPDQPTRRLNVYCDQDTDGGGWTYIQHRTNQTNKRENFYRKWSEYEIGFGKVDEEHWMGLFAIHVMTSTVLQELRVELQDYEGAKRYAKYSFFHIKNAALKYALDIGSYTGDAGDAIGTGGHLGSSFSTHDADNDSHDSSCAQRFRGGWWYAACHLSNLNGFQHVGSHTSFADGINWHPWKGYNYSLMSAKMMIRPAF